MKINFHPVASLFLMWLVTYPICKRFEKDNAEIINEAYKDDEKMYFACGKPRPVKQDEKPDYGQIGSRKRRISTVHE